MADRRSRAVFISSALFFLLLGCSLEQRISISGQERLSLLQLRSSLGLRAREWPIRSDPCASWVGIRCAGGRVTGINISGFRRTRRGGRNPRFSVDALRNLTLLSSFNASNFALPGPIPEWLGLQLDALQVLDLRSCSVNGSLPATIGNLSSLVELYLSHNNLTGVIPSSLARLTSLNVLDLSQNMLSGQLPDELWSLPELQYLDVSVNNFTGTLPIASPRLSNNASSSSVVVNISSNSFYGNITPLITSFSFIDMSGNYFQGLVPIYARGAATSLDRNCLTNSTTAQRTLIECTSFYSDRNLVFDNFGSHSPPSSRPSRRSRRRSVIILLASLFGSIGLIIIGIALLIIIVCKRKRAHTSQRGGGSHVSVVGPTPPPLPLQGADAASLDSFSYEKILEATGELNESNLLKKGRSGDLYHGVLEGGVSVVVKKFDSSSSAVKELDFFSKVSHSRFVPLLGHCLEKEEEKFLVYRLMPNGDLSSSLFRKVGPDGNLQSLDWITRLKIAIGAAEGLSYLHHECNPPLVHRDVQASSILLDDKFEVRLGSLSEVCAQEGEIHQSRITKFLRLPQSSDQGNSGINPNATCAYDVHCFGKILLELVTGNLGISSPAADPTATKEWLDSTLRHVSIYDKDSVTNIVDLTLMIDEDLLEEVWAMAIVARSCLNPKPNRRPIMRYVLKALENPLKVVRDEQQSTSSDRLRTGSSRGSWNAGLFGSWRRSSSDVAAAQPGTVGAKSGNNNKVEGSSSGKSCTSSARKSSREIFPEPLEEGVV
ncbi:Probable LRR receptor-like serine/threonine-protein kinase [Striga hermonthica]|uniref:Probable LRR receptor-like serine/threonine-protein kinase n=1 Tax=Striga hermonthica TaxID=68872 RepID=A0A9N7ML77_STRHE|nr:Probable LRR receptor-like serine/threonine-protein kinase [Striga hermonthica]